MAASLAASIPAVGSSSTSKSCVGGERPGQQDALLLSSRQIPEQLMAERLGPEQGQRTKPRVEIRVVHALKRPGPGGASHQHHFKRRDREDRVDAVALRNVADGQPGLPLHLTVQRLQQTEDRAQQRGLAAAVRPHDSQDLSAVNVKRYVPQGRLGGCTRSSTSARSRWDHSVP